MRQTSFLLYVLIGLLATKPVTGFTQNKKLVGTIKGQVVDGETQLPLLGANVVLVGAGLGDATDEAGRFEVQNVAVGSYSLQFGHIAYELWVIPDVVVRSKRTSFVTAELKMSSVEMEQVVVSTGYFRDVDDQPTSLTNFSSEEIRRAPGSAGDVSRILMSLPSVAKVNDQNNGLIVRGGSPVENAFVIDNIEVPNINHFPTQGASGGPIGMVNVDFIRDVDFFTAGFPVAFGDRLSSVMNISFREGNRDEFDGQLDLNFAGFGGVAEGPLAGVDGSWLVSLRRSYLDLLVDAIDVGTTVAPRFGDLQWKLVYDRNPRHKITTIGLWGEDRNANDREVAIENDMLVFGDQDISERTTGVNWRALWGGNGYSKTSVSLTATKFDEDLFETGSADLLVRNRSDERSWKLRNVNHFRLSDSYSIDFGFEAKRLRVDYDNFYADYTDALGGSVDALALNANISASQLGGFAGATFEPSSRLTTTLGLRADYASLTKNVVVSPRLSFSYKLGELTAITGSVGLFHQNLPLLLMAQNDAHRNLAQPSSRHFVLGLNRFLTENTKLTLEVYHKSYDHFPIDPQQPGLFVLDELFYRYGFFFNHAELLANGKASSRGIELTVQKKLAESIYGLASGSWFRSRYKGGDGIWRNRVFDNRFAVSLEGGWRPNSKWEFSLRWILAGGAPFTPFDQCASTALNRAVLDETRINDSRQPAYHSLNLRFDRRFHYSGSNLVFYLSVWNAYNRENVAGVFWNQHENRPDVIRQWTLLPIFGLEFEF